MATFSEMLNRFAIVTVMNAKVYNAINTKDTGGYLTPEKVLEAAEKETELCTLDTLKIANVTMDGPSKTVTGGQYSNPLVKFGKSARLEMQDALGNKEAIKALCGGIVSDSTGSLNFGENFEGPKTIIGDSFFIEQKSGAQVPVKIIFYSFLPDSLFNLTQDAEGDATVFDMNGDLMTTLVSVNGETTGLFYSIVDPNTKTYVTFTTNDDGTVTATVASGYTLTIDGEAIPTIAKDSAARVVVKDSSGETVYDEVYKNY